MEKILRNDKVKTYCMHCGEEFETVWACKIESIIGTRYVLFCTGCQKLIGIYSSMNFIKQMVSQNIVFNELRNTMN